MDIQSLVRERARVHVDLPPPTIRIQRRLAAGITRPELADILNVTPQAIGRWERGERTPRGDLLTAYVQALRALEQL